MPTFKELAKHDPRMRSLLLLGAIFVLLPPIFIFFKDPFGWSGKGEYLLFIVFGLGGPLLVIGGFLFSHWRKLTRLAEGGLEVSAIVEKTWSIRHGRMAAVRFAVGGTEYRVNLEVPTRHWDIDEGASATLLVDPEKPGNVSLVEVRSVFADLRSKLTSPRSPTPER